MKSAGVSAAMQEKMSDRTMDYQNSRKGCRNETERMKKRNAFMECHPLLQFLYFIAVILTTMLNTHPFIMGLSFLGAFLYQIQLHSLGKVLKKQCTLVLPLFLIVVLINTLFNHYGVTVLFYIHTGAVTLEAVVYGVVLAFMLWTAIIWFDGVNCVMTTDRMIYLFGKIVPSLSLLLSMVLRFIPRFTKQYSAIRQSREGLGIAPDNMGRREKVKNVFQEFSILITWSLESGIDTADSMRARGYGLKRRTSYAIFHCSRRDILAVVILAVLYILCMIGFFSGYARAVYNPRIVLAGFPFTWQSAGVYLAWGIFCAFPTVFSCLERRAWK